MENILDGGDYEVVKTNPTPKLEKKLNDIYAERTLGSGGNEQDRVYDRLRSTYSATPQLYTTLTNHCPLHEYISCHLSFAVLYA